MLMPELVRGMNVPEELRTAGSYEEWTEIAKALDRQEGNDVWRGTEACTSYDHHLVRDRLERIRRLRKEGRLRDLLFLLNEGVHSNLGGIGKPSLYNKAWFGTKFLIHEFLEEMCHALEDIAAADDQTIPEHEKRDFFQRASHCNGRTALMLSGGAVLGFFHAGVLKALFDEGLLPRIISGSSAGSMLAATACTHTDEELRYRLSADNLHHEAEETEEVRPQISWFGQQQPTVDAHRLREYVANIIPDLTFKEAQELTGRSLNITVTGLRPEQAPRLLNAITAPNVYIRSAVMASCAVYGIYPPVTLESKNADGERVPYLPDMQWIDGSFVDDLPANRLGRLYAVNHFICSMTNPAALAITPDPDTPENPVTMALDYYVRMIKSLTTEALKLSRDHVRIKSPTISLLQHLSYSILAQEYTADINIFLRNRWDHPTRLLSAPSREAMIRLIREGEVSTWEKVEMVRNCTAVSRTLDRILEENGWQEAAMTG